MASNENRDDAKPRKPRRPRAERAALDGKARAAPALSAGVEGQGRPDDVWTLRLYVAGDSPKSRTALANLQRLCEAYLEGKYEIEVIDLKTRPDLAKADQILALPTLVRKVPEPMKRLIGDLSNAERALLVLELGAARSHHHGSPKHARHVD